MLITKNLIPKKWNNFFLIELVLVITYTLMVLFYSTFLFPAFFILGLICVLFFPGYNLINLIKPKIDRFLKIGYSTIVSIALENALVFLTFVFFHDFLFFSTGLQYFYNNSFLVLVIQLINIVLIVINFRNIKRRTSRTENLNNDNDIPKIIKKLELNDTLIFIAYIFFIIVLVISILVDRSSSKEFIDIYHEHRTLFAFFSQLNLTFYIVLFLICLFLIYLILFGKNQFLVIFSIALFFYLLWIIPYLYFNNYFSADSYNLSQFLIEIKNNEVNFLTNQFKYTTSIISSLILLNATKIGINLTLWFTYPIILLPLPFLFYGIFKTLSTRHKSLTILTFFAMLVPQFLKFAHSATTGPIGAYIFYILVYEFFKLMNSKYNKVEKKRAFLFIIFLFFFLTITHFEECIYFLIIVILYSNYHFFVYFKEIESKNLNIKLLKEEFYNFILLFYFLVLILYISQEIITNWALYISGFLGDNFISRSLIYVYENIGLVKLFFFSEVKINLIFILGITLITLILFLIYSSIFIGFLNFLQKFEKKNKNLLIRIFDKIKKKLFSKKITPYLTTAIIFLALLFLDKFYIQFLDFDNILVFLEISLSFGIILFNFFLFVSGIKYYGVKNRKQNYFLIAIFSTSIVFLGFFINNKILLFSSTFQNRFLTYFIFFNLIIIQNTYFPIFINKRKLLLFLGILVLVWLGVFYSFKKLSWG